MLRFVVDLIRPYRRTLVVILLAMLVETVMNLAGPWPLKIILDNVIGDHKMSPWLHRLIGPLLEMDRVCMWLLWLRWRLC